MMYIYIYIYIYILIQLSNSTVSNSMKYSMKCSVVYEVYPGRGQNKKDNGLGNLDSNPGSLVESQTLATMQQMKML